MHGNERNSAPFVQEKPVTTDKKPFEEMNTIAKQIKEQALLHVFKEDHFIQPFERYGSWRRFEK
jgi:hypothetical protein